MEKCGTTCRTWRLGLSDRAAGAGDAGRAVVGGTVDMPLGAGHFSNSPTAANRRQGSAEGTAFYPYHLCRTVRRRVWRIRTWQLHTGGVDGASAVLDSAAACRSAGRHSTAVRIAQ